jgi:integrase
MATKTKVKEPIRLRIKKLANGNQSLYLDFYQEGKREYEFLKLYLIPETSAANKAANSETLKLANAIKAQKIVELQNNRHGFTFGGLKSKTNLVEYIENFADKKVELADENGGRPGVYYGYKSLAYHLKRYSGNKTTFKEVDKKYCMGFIEYLKTAKVRYEDVRVLNTNTQLSYIIRLSSILNCAVQDEIIVSNPFHLIKSEEFPKAPDREISYLTIEEVQKLINTPCFYPDLRNCFLFSCFTGLRISDIRQLKWGKILKDNSGKAFISYTQKKTGNRENLPIGKDALKFLPERGNAKDEDFVFQFRSGSNGHENVILKTWAKSAGIEKKITFHTSRHTNATLLLSLEVPIETVSKLLGHTNIKTTQIYAKVIDRNKREAVDKLDGLVC